MAKTAPGFVKEPKIWAMVMQSLVDGLKRKGRSPDAVMRRFGLSEDMVRTLYREVPLRSYVAAFEAAAGHVGDANFGLFAARDISPFTLGPIGLLFMSAPTLGAALTGFVDYIWLAQQGTTSSMLREGDSCVFRYRIEDPAIIRRRQDAEFSVALLVQMVRALVGPTWRPQEVHFEHAAPADLRVHRAFFGAPLYFNQTANEMVFPASDLVVSGKRMDHRVGPVVGHYLDLLNERKQARRSLSEEVRRMVSDHYQGEGDLGVGEAARKACVSQRTLQRALHKTGDTFSGIKQSRRRDLADSYLTSSDLSMTEIAHILGYADAACFTRACRRWFGMAPSAYRKAARMAEVLP